MGEDEPMDEEHIQEKESDGLEEFWNEYSVALESSKLDTLEEAANEKEVNNVCNHEIQIHEDLGHVCRVCGMIVREGLTQSLIIDGERSLVWLYQGMRGGHLPGGHIKSRHSRCSLEPLCYLSSNQAGVLAWAAKESVRS